VTIFIDLLSFSSLTHRQPRSTLFPYTTLFRSGRIRDGDGEGRSGDRPNPRNGGQPPTHHVRPVFAHDHRFDRLDARLERAQLGEQALQRLSRQSWHLSIVSTLQQVHQVSDAVPARRRDDAELAEMAADCVDQHGPLPNQQAARSMTYNGGLL